MSDGENVLRILAVREAGLSPDLWRLDPYEGEDDTPLKADVHALHLQRASRKAFAQLARAFADDDGPIRRRSDAELDLDALAAWTRAHATDAVDELDLEAAAQALGAADLATLVASGAFTRTQTRLADTILGDSLAGRVRTITTDEVAALLKGLLLLRLADAGTLDAPPQVSLSEWLARTVLVLPRVDRAAPDRVELPEPPPEPDLKELHDRLGALELARSALRRAAADPKALRVRGVARDRAPLSRLLEVDVGEPPGPLPINERQPDEALRREDDRLKVSRLRAERLSQAISQVRQRGAAFGVEQERDRESHGVRLDPEVLTRLPDAARKAAEEAGVDPGDADPYQALHLVESAVADITRQLPTGEGRRMMPMAGGLIDLTAVKQVFTLPPSLGLKLVGGCQLNAGIGDLLIVRQDLKAYELSDFAHVENVLAGEFREREHRRLDLTEETTTAEAETTTEKERDLSSTERNEMQSEAEKSVQTEFGLEAGLQISGSYGPTVSFSSSLNASFSTTGQESQRRAASFSKEVTERVAERVRERVRKETQRRVLSQVEELNRHRIDNAGAGADHVRGIYRWLTKVYDAQVFDYGKRMMIEFVVPEPAAWFMFAATQATPKAKELVKPSAPKHLSGRPLAPEHLDFATAQSLIAEYKVTDAPPHPASSVVVSHFDGMDGTGSFLSLGRGNKVPIPAGYTCTSARISSASGGAVLDSYMIFVGGCTYVPLWDGLTTTLTFDHAYTGEISVSLYAPATEFFVLGLDLFCVLSDDGLRKWQQETFDAIMRAYEKDLADYEEKLAALEIQQGIKIFGRNPLENRRLEREELKKIAVMVLTDDTDPSLDGYEGVVEPEIDLDAACSNGVRVRFFENAFEWPNMTYVFYPYFWGRRARWEAAVNLTDPDPDFAAFLKAGAARVQVPVRPGFEKAVAYFLQTGAIWNGGDPPLIGDELYVPIVEEIAESLNRPQEMQPYPEDSESWEVRVPTSLVLLQDLEEIPGIVDTLTGNAADITPA